MSEKWTFEENQRDAVCKGELCPTCLTCDIVRISMAPDMERLNAVYFCKTCQEEWEGY